MTAKTESEYKHTVVQLLTKMRRDRVLPFGWLVVAALLSLLRLARPMQAAQVSCAAGDVGCLINAIHIANASRTPITIVLAAGLYTPTAMDHNTDGPTGLPSVTSGLTLEGLTLQGGMMPPRMGAAASISLSD